MEKPQGFCSHADYYERGPYARFLKERRVMGRQLVDLFEANQPAGRFPDPPLPTALLYLARRGAKEACFDWGAGSWRGTWREGDLTLVPPNAASDVSLSESHAFLGICLPVEMFGTEVDPEGKAAVQQFGRLYTTPFRDRLVTELCETLWREGDSLGTGCCLFADSALQCIADRLRHMASFPPSRVPHRLSSKVLGQLDEFIRNEINRRITVADMAAVADCSPSHFTVLFKKATGGTPYRYVVALRLEHARSLMATAPEMGLADIALASGFSSQSHMTTVFRQAFGLTPSRFMSA